MSKAFWEGFKYGFTTASKYGIPIAAAFILGLILGSYSHPYEQCARMYNSPEYISECVWIKENS
jgi:regulation of enolase protein 1 (concanavalin A-like superfamily)